MTKEELNNATIDSSVVVVSKTKINSLNRKIKKLELEKEKLEDNINSYKEEIKKLQDEIFALKERPVVVLNQKVKDRYKERIKYYESIEKSLKHNNDCLSRMAFDLWHDIAVLQGKIVELKKNQQDSQLK